MGTCGKEMSFEIEHKGVIVIVGKYDEQSGEIAIEDVINPETGEVLTDEWFDSGDIYNQNLRQKIKQESRKSQIDDIL